jgi:hypothetical protein
MKDSIKMDISVEQLIMERSYASLTEAEKAAVSELCASEQEFNRMKQFFIGMGSISRASAFEPPASLKSSLDSVFAAKHGGIGAKLTPRKPVSAPEAARIIPFYSRSWFKVAAAVTLVAGIFTIWKVALPGKLDMGQKELAQAERPQTLERESLSEEIPAAEEQALQSNKKPASAVPAAPLEALSAPVSEDQVSWSSYNVQSYGFIGSYSVTPDFGTVDAIAPVAEGISADLYPSGIDPEAYYSKADASAASFSVAESQGEDVLGMIVPAF